MRSLFQWLDAHPAFYWAMLVAVVVMWVMRCREVVARSRDSHSERWDVWLWLSTAAVVLAGRWPELFVAHGVTEEEARVVLGARALAVDFHPFRVFVFSGGGPLASAALLPSHWLGVPLDYFNARLVALLCDLAALGGVSWVLRRRFGAVASAHAAGALALLLAWPGGQWAGAVSQHLCLCLSAVSFVILGWRPWRGIDWPAVGAGLIVGLLPWVHRDAGWWTVFCLAAGAWLLGELVRVRCFVCAAIYSLVVFGAWVWGTGAWGDCWGYYLRGAAVWGASVDWWILPLVMIAVAVGAAVVGKSASGKYVGKLAGALAVVGLAGIAVAGRPAMLGQLAEHWRHPRVGIAADIRALTGDVEEVAIWGDVTAPVVEAGRNPAVAFHIDARSDVASQERWFDVLRRRETSVLVVANGPRPEKLDTMLQDHFRLQSAGDRGQVFLRNARMFAYRTAQVGVVPITLQSLAVAEAYGGSVTEVGKGRISTHAPARLVAPVPSGVQRVAGVFGFYPDAYRHAGRTTDGGKFSVVWWRGSQSEIGLERWLTPGHVAGDRGAQEFDLELPQGVDAVEFKVEPGRTMSFDWAYWGELRFGGAR